MIKSVSNPLVKQLIALKNKKERDNSGKFMLEGQRFVGEIPPDWQIDCYVLSESFSARIDAAAYAKRAKTHILPDSVFKKISDTLHPQGIMAVCVQKRQPPHLLEECLRREDAFILFGEKIADPGNLGTVIRTAAAASCHAVMLSKGCVDVYNPKTLRATAGAFFQLPVMEGVDVSAGLSRLSENGFKIVAAHVHGSLYPYDVDLSGKCCILIGNEAEGLSRSACDLSHYSVKIPMAPQVDSLNASVASGILLYEAVRQRLKKPH